MSPAPAPDPTATPSYRRVFAYPGFISLVAGVALARTAQQMAAVALVLFTLERHGSAGLAGLVVFLLLGPGLLISPLAGALLDRHGRIRLITFDYVLAGAVLGLLVILDIGGALPAVLLCGLVTIGSLTAPLSNSGTRSLFPLVLPRDLWDRANAVDSGGYVVAMVVGPALAGGVAAAAGPRWAIGATAAVYIVAALVVCRAPEPEVAGSGHGLLADARDGILYVLRSRSLRGLALCLFVYNLGGGSVVVLVPLLVLDRFGGGAADVGVLFALQGAGGLIGALLAGAFDSTGRERMHLAGGMLLSVAAMAMIAVAPTVQVAAAGMVLLGAGNGPIDIGLFALRQRRTHLSWVGRVFAISMALNFSGFPIGSAIGGVVGGHSPALAFGLAAIAAAAGAAVAWWAIPAHWEADAESAPAASPPRDRAGAVPL